MAETLLPLEIAKMAVQALTPVAVAYIGWQISKRIRDLEQKQWSARTLIEKRIEIYDDISPLLNRLLCYFTFRGDWQKHTPIDIIDTKRSLDQKVHINRFLLDEKFFLAYQEFIKAIFKEFSGPGRNALLRTYISSGDGDRKKAMQSGAWDNLWDNCFFDEMIAPKEVVWRKYKAVMEMQKAGIFPKP